MPRALVILTSSSYRVTDFVRAADSLGVELAIAGDQEPPLGIEDRFVRIDCEDPETSAEAIADLATSTPIDAVVAADDQGVEIAARAAGLVGLPQNPTPAATATRDKLRMRQELAESEVAQPEFVVLGEDPVRDADGLGYPLVVKPRTLSGSRGVIRVDNPASLPSVVARVSAIRDSAGAADLPLIAERFIPGPEISVEGMLWDGETEILAIFDKPVPLDGPYFEETIFVTPSRLPADTVAEAELATRRAARALGLRQGPIHAELRIGPDGPVVIEVAARSIGGLCGRALRFGLMGTALEVMILRHALGMRKESLRREHAASGVLMVPIPNSGVLRRIDGVEAVQDLEHVSGIEWSVHPGSHIEAVPDGDRYLGFVFVRGDSPEAVELTLRRAQDLLDVIVEA